MRHLLLNQAGLLLVFTEVVWSQHANEWGSIAPTEAGFDAAKLERWRSTLEGHRTTGLLAMRHGRIVLEWYAHGWDAEKPHGTASMARLWSAAHPWR